MKIEISGEKKKMKQVSPLTAEGALRALIDLTLSNAKRFYSSMGNPLDGKGLGLSIKQFASDKVYALGKKRC